MASRKDKKGIRRAIADIREKMSESGATAHLGRLPDQSECFHWAHSKGLCSGGNPSKALADYGARIVVDEPPAKSKFYPHKYADESGGKYLIRSTGSGRAHILVNGEPLCRIEMRRDKYVSVVEKPAQTSLCMGCEKLSKTDPRNARPESGIASFYFSWQWKKARYETLKRYGAVCMCCGSDRHIVVDHIKPRSKYPEFELDMDNLQVLCRDCNMGKSNDDETDWRPVNAEAAELEIVAAAVERLH